MFLWRVGLIEGDICGYCSSISFSYTPYIFYISAGIQLGILFLCRWDKERWELVPSVSCLVIIEFSVIRNLVDRFL